MAIKLSEITLEQAKDYCGVPTYVTDEDFKIQVSMDIALSYVIIETRRTAIELDEIPAAAGVYLHAVYYNYKHRDSLSSLKEDEVHRNMLNRISKAVI